MKSFILNNSPFDENVKATKPFLRFRCVQALNNVMMCYYCNEIKVPSVEWIYLKYG